MMKFSRIIRNSRDTVVHVVMLDKDMKRVELWRWDAELPAGATKPPVLLRHENYSDPMERFALIHDFHADARTRSKHAS